MCGFYQCIPVISDFSILLLKNQKVLCNISEVLIIFHKTFFFYIYFTMRHAAYSYTGGRQKAHLDAPVGVQCRYLYIYYCKGILKYVTLFSFHKWDFGAIGFYSREKPKSGYTAEQDLSAFGALFLIFKTQALNV